MRALDGLGEAQASPGGAPCQLRLGARCHRAKMRSGPLLISAESRAKRENMESKENIW